MANVGDVLLPVAGGILGMNPYIGGGIRTALTVDQALGRRKWQEAEAQRKKDESEAEAAAKQAEAEQAKADLDGFIGIVDEWGGPESASLKIQARTDLGGAIKDFRKIRGQAPPVQGRSPEDIASVSAALREQNPDATYQFTSPFEGGGSVSTTLRPDAPQESEQAHDPGWKASAGMPWVFHGRDESGGIVTMIVPDIKAQYEWKNGPAVDDLESRRAEAELEVQEARAELEEYTTAKAKKDKDEREREDQLRYEDPLGTGSSSLDEGYKLRRLRLSQAEARLEAVLAGVQPEPDESSQGSTEGNVTTYDVEGNPIS